MDKKRGSIQSYNTLMVSRLPEPSSPLISTMTGNFFSVNSLAWASSKDSRKAGTCSLNWALLTW